MQRFRRPSLRLSIAVALLCLHGVSSDSLRELIGVQIKKVHRATSIGPQPPRAFQTDRSPAHSRKLAPVASEAKAYASKSGFVLWTLANSSWLEFVLNWVKMVKKAGIENYFVATLDDELAVLLKKQGIPCIMLHTHLGGGDLNWGSDAFKKRGIEKIQFIISMLETGLQPLFSDLDVVWLKNPTSFLASLPEPNILISSDSCNAQLQAKLDDCTAILGTKRTVDGNGGYVGTMNVGIHLIRPSAIHFAKAWLEEMKASGAMEQLCWNRVFMRNLTEKQDGDKPDLYCRSMSGTITAGILPAAAFMNGHTAFAQQLVTGMKLDPFAVHASWVPGAEMKRFHFREEGMWMVDEDTRFNAPSQRLLALDMEVPTSLLEKAGPPAKVKHRHLELKEAEGHFYLLRHQFLQVKAAAEIAAVLNRTLIMPKMYCGLENLWQPHKGRYWDGVQNYTLPMQCSMTQLFDVLRWKKEAEKEGILPQYVESSFLDSPKLLLGSNDTMVMDICDREQGFKDSTECCEKFGPTDCSSTQTTAFMPRLLEKSDLNQLMKQAEGVKLVRVKNVLQFWPLASSQQFSKFDYAFDGVRRDWCCAKDNKRVFVDVAIHGDSH